MHLKNFQKKTWNGKGYEFDFVTEKTVGHADCQNKERKKLRTSIKEDKTEAVRLR